MQEPLRKFALEMKIHTEKSTNEQEEMHTATRRNAIQASIEEADIEGYIHLREEERRCPQCGSDRTGALSQITDRGTLIGSLIFIVAALLYVTSQLGLQTTQVLLLGLAGLALAAICVGSFVRNHGKGARYGCLSCGHKWYVKEGSSFI